MIWLNENSEWMIWIAIIVGVWFFWDTKDNNAENQSANVYEATQSNRDCHLSYSGCLKLNASDYDCAEGSGNGPYYTGKVKVIGPDVFGLDRDHDGWGCE